MTESEERALYRLVAAMAVVVGSHLANAGDDNWKALSRRQREWEDARGVQHAQMDAANPEPSMTEPRYERCPVCSRAKIVGEDCSGTSTALAIRQARLAAEYRALYGDAK
jgi:hypothetical protein